MCSYGLGLSLALWVENNVKPNYSLSSIIRCTKSQKIEYFSFRIAVDFVQSTEVRCWVENEDVAGAAPTGDAPATS